MADTFKRSLADVALTAAVEAVKKEAKKSDRFADEAVRSLGREPGELSVTFAVHPVDGGSRYFTVRISEVF